MFTMSNRETMKKVVQFHCLPHSFIGKLLLRSRWIAKYSQLYSNIIPNKLFTLGIIIFATLQKEINEKYKTRQNEQRGSKD